MCPYFFARRTLFMLSPFKKISDWQTLKKKIPNSNFTNICFFTFYIYIIFTWSL